MNLARNWRHKSLWLLLCLACTPVSKIAASPAILNASSEESTTTVPLNMEELRNSNVTALIDLYKERTPGNDSHLSVVSPVAASSNKIKGSRQDDADAVVEGGDGPVGALTGVGQTYGQMLATNILDVVTSSLTGNIGGIITGSLRIFRNPMTQNRVSGGLGSVAGSIASLVGITTPNPNKLNQSTAIQGQGVPGDFNLNGISGNFGNQFGGGNQFIGSPGGNQFVGNTGGNQFAGNAGGNQFVGSPGGNQFIGSSGGNQFVGSSGPGGPDFINPGNGGSVASSGGSPGTTIVNARPGQQVFVVVDHSRQDGKPTVSQVSPSQLNSQGFVPINPQSIPVIPQINLNVLPAQNYPQQTAQGNPQQQTQQQQQQSKQPAFPERTGTSPGKEEEDEDEDEDSDDLVVEGLSAVNLHNFHAIFQFHTFLFQNVERGISSDPLRGPKQDDDDDDSDSTRPQLGTYGTRLAGNILALLGSAATADIPGILLNSFGIANDESVGTRIREFVNFLTNGTGSIPLVSLFLPTLPTSNVSISSIKESVGNLNIPSPGQIGSHTQEGFNGVSSHVQESVSNFGSNLGDHVSNLGSNVGGHVSNFGTHLGENVNNLGSNVGGHVSNFGTHLGENVNNLGSNVGGHVSNFGSNLGDNVANSQVVQNFQEQTGIGGGGDSSGAGGASPADTGAYQQQPHLTQEQQHYGESSQVNNDIQQVQQQQSQPQPQTTPATGGAAAVINGISGLLSAFGFGTSNQQQQQPQQQMPQQPQQQNPYYYPTDPSQQQGIPPNHQNYYEQNALQQQQQQQYYSQSEYAQHSGQGWPQAPQTPTGDLTNQQNPQQGSQR